MMKAIVGFFLALGLATSAWAETEKETGLYVGLVMGTDKINTQGVDDASGAGIMAGWRFHKNFALEVAGYGSDAAADSIMPGCIFEISTAALYITGRSNGQIYGKSRIGVLSETITGRDTCVFAPEVTGSSLSAGLGLGLRLNNAALEFEYTTVEADVDRLSLSILYNF